MAKANEILDYLVQLDNEARQFGFEWSDTTQIIDWVIGECQEVREAILNGESQERIQEEIGDVIYCAISLCLYAGFDVNKTLLGAGNKLEKRFTALKAVTQESGYKSLKNIPSDIQLNLWKKAKERCDA